MATLTFDDNGNLILAEIPPRIPSMAGNKRTQAAASSTDTSAGTRQRERRESLANPKKRGAVKAEDKRKATQGLRETRKKEDEAEQAVYMSEDAYRKLAPRAGIQKLPVPDLLTGLTMAIKNRLDPPKGELHREFEQTAAAQIPVTRSNETTGRTARHSLIGRDTKELSNVLDALRQGGIQPSSFDNPLKQAQKGVLRSGPYAAMPIIPLAQSLYHVAASHEEAAPGSLPERVASDLSTNAANSPASAPWSDVLSTLAFINSAAGDLAVTAPLTHGTALGMKAQNAGKALADVTTRKLLPRLTEMGVEGAERGALRVLPKVAEASGKVGYEAGMHAPLWGTEKIFHPATAGMVGGIDSAILDAVLRSYGAGGLSSIPETIRKGY